MAELNKKNGLANDFLSIDHGVCTHIGQRQHNQDNVLMVFRPARLQDGPLIYAVADGMGGQPGGAIASRMACNGLKECIEQLTMNENTQNPIDFSRQMVDA